MLYVWSSQQCSLCIQLKITYHLRHCLILLKKWTYFHYITMVQETSFNLLDLELCWELFSTTHCFCSVAYIKPCSVQNSRWISDMCNFTILYSNKFNIFQYRLGDLIGTYNMHRHLHWQIFNLNYVYRSESLYKSSPKTTTDRWSILLAESSPIETY